MATKLTEAELKRISEIVEEKSTTRKNALKILHREERAAEKSSKPKKERKAKAPRVKKESAGRMPVLIRYVKSPMTIYASFKGKEFEAKVIEDGTIKFDGKEYTSPSVAGAAAMKTKTCNGWKFWRVAKDGDFIDTLRKAS